MENIKQKVGNDRSSMQTMILDTTIFNIQQNKEAIFQKIIDNDIETVKAINLNMLNLNQYITNVKSLIFIDQYITPLIFCAYQGRLEMMALLLNNRIIDVDLQTKQNQYTPIAAACLGRNYQIVKLLIDFKAEVNKPNSKYQTPLTITLNNLIKYQSFQNRCICFKIAELLTNHGADVNWILDKQRGYTFLHILTSRKELNQSEKKLNYDIIKFLLSKGASLKLRGFDEKNPQDLVINHCNRKLLNQLFQNQKILRTTKYKTQASEQGNNQKIQYYDNFFKKNDLNLRTQNNEQSKSVLYNVTKKKKFLDRPIFTQSNETVSLAGQKKLGLKKKILKFLGIKYK